MKRSELKEIIEAEIKLLREDAGATTLFLINFKPGYTDNKDKSHTPYFCYMTPSERMKVGMYAAIDKIAGYGGIELTQSLLTKNNATEISYDALLKIVKELRKSKIYESVEFARRPDKTSNEILYLIIKALPKNITDAIKYVEPNGNRDMATPPTISNKGQSRGSIGYKSVELGFEKGKTQFSDGLTIGLRKRTSGPFTGYIAIYGHGKEAATEFFDNPIEALKELYNKTF